MGVYSPSWQVLAKDWLALSVSAFGIFVLIIFASAMGFLPHLPSVTCELSRPKTMAYPESLLVQLYLLMFIRTHDIRCINRTWASEHFLAKEESKPNGA